MELKNHGSKGEMAVGFCKDCDSAFWSSGRRVVDGIGEEHRLLPVDRRQVGLHNTASSPASPTKETIERSSLFCLQETDLTPQSCPKRSKTPWDPIAMDPKGYFLPIRTYSLLSPLISAALLPNKEVWA